MAEYLRETNQIKIMDRQALQLCMKSGLRFMECKRIVYQIVLDLSDICPEVYDHEVWDFLNIDYPAYAERMKAAGL